MIYTLDGKDYTVEIIRKNNKNTYFRIKDDMTIQVTTNRLTTKLSIKMALDSNKDALRKMINHQEKQNEYNEKFLLLGKSYEVIYVPSMKDVQIDGDKIYVKDDKKLNKWINSEMIRIFEGRLKYNYNLFEENIPFPKLKTRLMKTRWGVCNRTNKTVTLNSSLIREPIERLDYVIVHELSHLVHFNHSKDFWNVVSKYCPDYKRIRKELGK